MRAYWARVAKRAVKEAFVAVFISPERAVISLLLQIIAGAVIYLALGEAEVKPEVRIISAFAPLLIFPAVFVWKMFAVPALMHRELRREEDADRRAQLWDLGQVYVREENPANKELINHYLALPPEEWLNAKLEELNFAWRIRIGQGTDFTTEDVA